jgi:peptide/nickel transport system permease protein
MGIKKGDLSLISKTAPVEAKTVRNKREGPFIDTIRKLVKIPLANFGFAVIIIVLFCVFFAPWIAPCSPLEQNVDDRLAGISTQHLLGTDELGRDILSRIIYGSRISIVVSLGAVSFGAIIGVILGLLASYAGKWVDEILMRVMDALFAFPSLILAIGLVAGLGPSLINIIIAIGVANIPWMARIVRSQALSLKERDFVRAARSLGAGSLKIIFRHIWPNCAAPVIVQCTLGMAYAIIAEAALSFLGLGVPPPTPTWGMMLRLAFPLLHQAPLLSIVPGLAIFLLVLAFNFVGDALRDVLDPRLRGVIKW